MRIRRSEKNRSIGYGGFMICTLTATLAGALWAAAGDVVPATASPQGVKVLAKAALLNSNAWTVPSLVGTRLYVRDRKIIMALDLS